jgi:hypothetical protein
MTMQVPRSQDAVASVIGVAALGLLIGSPWLVDTAGPDPFYKGPLIYPMLVLGLTLAGALPAVWRLGLALLNGERPDLRLRMAARTALVFVALCGFPFAIAFAGLQLATFSFALLGLWLAGFRRPLASLVIAAGLTLVVHLAFIEFLDIWFPAPDLFELLGGS